MIDDSADPWQVTQILHDPRDTTTGDCTRRSTSPAQTMPARRSFRMASLGRLG
jgi:hypothetical protein